MRSGPSPVLLIDGRKAQRLAITGTCNDSRTEFRDRYVSPELPDEHAPEFVEFGVGEVLG
jgi:hypothetical protein